MGRAKVLGFCSYEIVNVLRFFYFFLRRVLKKRGGRRNSQSSNNSYKSLTC